MAGGYRCARPSRVDQPVVVYHGEVNPSADERACRDGGSLRNRLTYPPKCSVYAPAGCPRRYRAISGYFTQTGLRNSTTGKQTRFPSRLGRWHPQLVASRWKSQI